MARDKDLVQRFKQNPKDFTWEEFRTLMGQLGYKMLRKSGSARRFYNERTGRKIYIHEPHPGKILKTYQVTGVLKRLEEFGEI